MRKRCDLGGVGVGVKGTWEATIRRLDSAQYKTSKKMIQYYCQKWIVDTFKEGNG